MAAAESGGSRRSACRSVASRPVLLIHGSLANGRMWARYLNAFALGREVCAVDLIGYGATDGWPSGQPLRLADEASAVCRAVAHADEPVDVVAHSYGGAVALRLVLDNPGRVASLTLVEPACFNLLRHLGPAAAAARAEIEMVARMVRTAAVAGVPELGIAHFVDYWNGRGTWAQLSASRRQTLLAKASKVAQDFDAIFAEGIPLAGLRKVQIPTLIVLGTNSPAPATHPGRALARVLPRGSMITVQGAGHMLPVTHPEALTAILAARLGTARSEWRAAA